MSGALVDLVAKGVQDAYLTGNPEVSFFRSTYKRHTNFAFRPYRLDYTGTFNGGNEVVVKIPHKGDILSYIWVEGTNIALNGNVNALVGSNVAPSEFDLYIGGQLVDRQDAMFKNLVWGAAGYPDTSAKADLCSGWGVPNENDTPIAANTFPLHFFFCDSYKNAIPIVALQYHEIEIRIKCRSGLANLGASPKIFANYIFLDTDERKYFVDNDHQILIPQVQRLTLNSSSDTSVDTSYFNHPVQALHLASTALIGQSNIYTDRYTFNDLTFYINGTPLFEEVTPNYCKFIVPFHHGKHTNHGQSNEQRFDPLFTLPFTLSLSWSQPGGSINFSRLDNSTLKIKNPITTAVPSAPVYLYAVNWNVLRIKRGLAGLAFSN